MSEFNISKRELCAPERCDFCPFLTELELQATSLRTASNDMIKRAMEDLGDPERLASEIATLLGLGDMDAFRC